MKRIAFSLLCTLLAANIYSQTFDVDKQLDYCHHQVMKSLQQLRPYDFTQEPRNILAGQHRWNCRRAVAEEWCSGFWPGILWMDYSYSHSAEVLHAAKGYTEVLKPLAYQPIYDHDLGFIMIGSFGKGLTYSPMLSIYRPILLAAADSLATLYNAKAGTLLSWPRHVKDYGGHNTIMDNMINLDLLFWAAANGGSPLLRQIAITHATTTMRHHFRPDGSSYHVAVYDTLSGQFLRGQTHQGYADSSMWSRGQSWAIYGYTMVYRWTRDPLFLQFAQRVADIYLLRLRQTSDDMIPLWDMDDPRGLQAPKDASAACVVASALIELSTYLDNERRLNSDGQPDTDNSHHNNGSAHRYRQAAIDMLADLSTPRYQSRDRNSAFLLHSTGHHPAGSEIDASIIYADYYYLEALLRLKDLQQHP
ncbi:MAG: glycoside hydrolase family 88 protein [Bacteroidaceae bacterium]|nr:glycoside hydrolase family 88 protein [Bacteroidaceae bacterium]